ncbi:MotA/TolQ/ExbB proton channel family protein [Proteiniborus sp.]|uniref:MotA/TolQ/ExbB proton channel family protein n=1 Tax=Proteiniborus sp. TaxID=2079015 RepID=UPI00331C4998
MSTGIFSLIVENFIKAVDFIANVVYLTFNDVFCGFIIFVAVYNFKKSHKLVKQNIKDIEDFTNVIKDLQGDIHEKLNALSNKNLFENNELLQEIWEKYFKSIRQSRISGSVNEISYYFNRTNIIDIPGRRKIAEIIPGILTALGILGTFLGLLEGITGLNTLNPEYMTDSINQLVSGMSLAFSTSIVGIISSIMWSSLDRQKYKYYLKVLNDFYNTFSEQFPINNEFSFLNDISNYQKEQTEAIKHMSTDISLEFSKAFDKTVNETLLPGLSNSMNKSLEGNILPAVESISQVVDNFANVATSNQTESLNKVVEKFIESMNESLNGQFDNLANTIQILCEWQIKTKDSLEELINEIEETTKNQQEINVSSEEVIIKFSQYFDRLIEANNDMDESLNLMKDVIGDMKELINHSNQISKDLENKQELFDLRNDTYFKNINEQIQKLEDDWDTTSQVFEKINNEFKDSTDIFVENLHKGLEATFKDFDDNLANITRRLSGTISEVQDTVDEVPSLIRTASDNMTNSLQLISITIEEVIKKAKIEDKAKETA